MHRLLAIYFVLVLPARETLAEDLTAALTAEELQKVSVAVDRGLQWLSTQQNADGSFNGVRHQIEEPLLSPTSLAVLAFLSRGHHPGQGRFGDRMNRAIEFVLSKQRLDGSFSTRPPHQIPYWREHAASALMLCEAYSFSSGDQMQSIDKAIPRALAFSRRAQETPKQFPEYRGGWHYADKGGDRDHLSSVEHTGWELTLMRSAQNAGFEVRQVWIDDALAYVERCYKSGPSVVGDRRLAVSKDQAVFFWYPKPPPGGPIWADFTTTASGMLALQLHGRRDDPLVQTAASWLAANTIPPQGTAPSFYKGCYLWGRTMSQVGGKRWENFYPRLVRRLMPFQDLDGHWRLDRYIGWGDDTAGPVFCTALSVLCLTLPDQLLPIHQR